MNKKELRILYRKIRKKLTSDYRAQSENVIIEKMINFFSNKPPAKISSFLPINDEINIKKFNQYVIHSHHTLLLPEVFEQKMFFINPQDANLTNSDSSHQIPNFCIMPCICYDSNKHRIGYGKGFYDSYLQDKRHIFKIIPNYAALKTNITIPKSQYDVSANLVINEEEEF